MNTTKKDWMTTMAWNAQLRAAIKRAAFLSGYLADMAGAEQAHRGEITARQLAAMEKIGGLLEQAMATLGCVKQLDAIEADLASELTWIEDHG